jgi:hypothetical protein
MDAACVPCRRQMGALLPSMMVLSVQSEAPFSLRRLRIRDGERLGCSSPRICNACAERWWWDTLELSYFSAAKFGSSCRLEY